VDITSIQNWLEKQVKFVSTSCPWNEELLQDIANCDVFTAFTPHGILNLIAPSTAEGFVWFSHIPTSDAITKLLLCASQRPVLQA